MCWSYFSSNKSYVSIHDIICILIVIYYLLPTMCPRTDYLIIVSGTVDGSGLQQKRYIQENWQPIKNPSVLEGFYHFGVMEVL